MTMRGETTPQPYEVWRILFVFDDQPDVFKFRPVIIGGIGKGGCLSRSHRIHLDRVLKEKSHCSTGRLPAPSVRGFRRFES